jgi:hypothetical protein
VICAQEQRNALAFLLPTKATALERLCTRAFDSDWDAELADKFERVGHTNLKSLLSK